MTFLLTEEKREGGSGWRKRGRPEGSDQQGDGWRRQQHEEAIPAAAFVLAPVSSFPSASSLPSLSFSFANTRLSSTRQPTRTLAFFFLLSSLCTPSAQEGGRLANGKGGRASGRADGPGFFRLCRLSSLLPTPRLLFPAAANSKTNNKRLNLKTKEGSGGGRERSETRRELVGVGDDDPFEFLLCASA